MYNPEHYLHINCLYFLKPNLTLDTRVWGSRPFRERACRFNKKKATTKSNHDFFCVGVMYSGEYDASDGIRNITYTNRPDRVAQLAEHWASIPKVVGSIPTVVRHIFQACPVWIYTQSNITSIIFT